MDFEELKKYFILGDIPGAIEYMDRFEELKEEAEAYKELFVNEHYLHYDVPEPLNEILLIYQHYFRNVFYCRMKKPEAASLLLSGLRQQLGIVSEDDSDIEDALKKLFESFGYNILTGDTQGYYGPYVWKTTQPTFYDVELPEGTARYRVNILRGFVMRSWMDYLTFGQYGAGGWTGKDGVINCIEKAYDFDSEKFRTSLLKHEAQHAEDLKRWPDMPAAELEYRAKLVELIYTQTPGLLEKFISEASDSDPDDSHAMANAMISKEMRTLAGGRVEAIQNRARELFEQCTL